MYCSNSSLNGIKTIRIVLDWLCHQQYREAEEKEQGRLHSYFV